MYQEVSQLLMYGDLEKDSILYQMAELFGKYETGEYNNSGDSTNRPLKPYVGFQYFDTSIGKPLFWNGSKWVDALGKEY